MAHDSHNIVAVGVDDESICLAVNKIIEKEGGVSAAVYYQSKDGRETREEVGIVALPVGGLMSNEDGYKVAEAYTKIDMMAKEMGCTLASPFMTLSFMALLVIPHLKLSDLGLLMATNLNLSINLTLNEFYRKPFCYYYCRYCCGYCFIHSRFCFIEAAKV